MAEETKNPSRNVPKAMTFSMILVSHAARMHCVEGEADTRRHMSSPTL